jgi:putative salt-induced outer membrane protein YdiY
VKIVEEENEVKIIKVESTEETETDEKAEVTAVKEETEAKKEVKTEESEASNPKNPAPGFTSGWDGSANLGFSLTSGNSRTSTFTAGVRAEKSGENDKWTTYANSLWNRNRIGGLNVTTSNAIWGGVRYDRNIT